MKWPKYLLLLLLLAGCERKPRPVDVPQKLKTTMAEFLKKNAGPDSTRAQFNVEEVVYFEDKDFFDCEFKVRMRANEKDTTGEMAATISKDFSQVTRKY